MKIKKNVERIISLFLCLLISFSSVLPLLFSIYAEDTAETRNANFINFYGDASGSVELELSNLTTQDYYAMMMFISNWFEPGKTKLSDLLNPQFDTGSVVDSFVTAIGKENGKESIGRIVQGYASDTLKAFTSGSCCLTWSDGSIINGGDVLATCANVVVDGWNYIDTSTVDSAIHYCFYFNNGKNLAFDLTEPTVRAAFQTIVGYNPDLFLQHEGIAECKVLFIDAIGNLWGSKASDIVVTKQNNIKGLKELTSSDAENIYLIMPACVNPSGFTPNVTTSKSQSELRMPLMNRFVLSSLAYETEFTDPSGNIVFQNQYIPIYDLLAQNTKKRVLTVLGLKTLSPYTLQTDRLYEDNHGDSKHWNDAQRRKDLASFLYNPSELCISKSESGKGKSSFASYAYIVFAMNLEYLNGRYADNKEKRGVLDLATNFTSGNKAFDAINDGAVARQQQLLTYFFTPTVLTLDKVSMNFYRYSPTNVQEDFEKQWSSYFSDPTNSLDKEKQDRFSATGLASSDITKYGLAGMGLFIEDIAVYSHNDNNDEDLINVVPANIKYSRFVDELVHLSPYDYIANPFVGYFDLLYNKSSWVEDSSWLSSSSGKFYPYKVLFLDDRVDKSYDKYRDMYGNLDKEAFDYDWDKYYDNLGLQKYNRPYTNELLILKENNQGFGNSMLFSLKNASNSIYHIYPSVDVIVNIGNSWIIGDRERDVALGSLLGVHETKLRYQIGNVSTAIDDYIDIEMEIDTENFYRWLIAFFGYSVMFPDEQIDFVIPNNDSSKNLSVFGATPPANKTSTMTMKNLGPNYTMGIYLGYIVDMMGLGTVSENRTTFGNFSSPFLPKYDISAKGGNMSLESMTGISGVDKSDDLSFEQKQKDLINRIYGLTTDGNNDYRNSWFKNLIEGLFLTFHRTITGTWGSSVSSITTGNTSTYNSVTGYIYTPTLEELSFTATLMNNYIKIYVICMLLVLFFVILMVLLHMRTWQQGVITIVIMSVALLFPYILISNTISISNKISDSVYSDRFDFWAMTEHQRSRSRLTGSQYMTDRDLWFANASNTSTLGSTDPGARIKWMAPKKVDMFQNLYSNADLSDSFVTNLQIFKWLFTSFIYDSEFVDTDVFGSFVYRPYNSIALEAESYYYWGQTLREKDSGVFDSMGVYNYEAINGNSYSYNIPNGLKTFLGYFNSAGYEGLLKTFSPAIGLYDKTFYTDKDKQGSELFIDENKYDDITLISKYAENGVDIEASSIGLWGLLSDEINQGILTNPDALVNETNPGIVSNLPENSSSNALFKDDDYTISDVSKAIFLKNTESPYYYFYSVLKSRYGDADLNGNTTFKKALLNTAMFKFTADEASGLKTVSKESPVGEYRDFLDLEGLFTYVIPYLKATNAYVKGWQDANYSDIEEFNFVYEVDKEGNVIEDTVGQQEGEDIHLLNKSGSEKSDYLAAVKRKNNLNRIWNMYCPWVESLYDLDVNSVRIKHAGKIKYIEDSLSPSSYLEKGRPMIFSPAEMNIRGYRYSDLTDIERRMQAVLEKTYTDLLYLVNYYDMDDDVILSAAAMYATFHFNAEFSDNHFLSQTVMLYPQTFELKNFNYDAFMRLALLNATGENVFGDTDLYERVLSKTNIFTGLLLVICDLVACIVIPLFKFLMIIGLLFLGLLICITCVINPPEKIFEMVNRSVLLPSCLFMALNIAFAVVMSFIIGEGLTTYVGSKTINFATNDPTITMLMMAGLGVVYTFFAWKILGILIESYKKFGMGTALAAVGIIGSVIAAGSQGLANKAAKFGVRVGGGAAKLGSGAVGAGIGAATAGKGNRLTGAMDGASKGARGIVKQRRAEKWRSKLEDETNKRSNEDLANRINELSKTKGDGTEADDKNSNGNTNSQENKSTENTKSQDNKQTENSTTPSNGTDIKENKKDKYAESIGKAKADTEKEKPKAQNPNKKEDKPLNNTTEDKSNSKGKKKGKGKTQVNVSLKNKRNNDKGSNGNRNNANRKSKSSNLGPSRGRNGSKLKRNNSKGSKRRTDGNYRINRQYGGDGGRSHRYDGPRRRSNNSRNTSSNNKGNSSNNRRN